MKMLQKILLKQSQFLAEMLIYAQSKSNITFSHLLSGYSQF